MKRITTSSTGKIGKLMTNQHQLHTISSKHKAPTNTTVIAPSRRFKRGTFHLTRPGTRVLRTPTPTTSPPKSIAPKPNLLPARLAGTDRGLRAAPRPPVKSPIAPHLRTRPSRPEKVSFETERAEGFFRQEAAAGTYRS